MWRSASSCWCVFVFSSESEREVDDEVGKKSVSSRRSQDASRRKTLQLHPRDEEEEEEESGDVDSSDGELKCVCVSIRYVAGPPACLGDVLLCVSPCWLRGSTAPGRWSVTRASD